ncbi:AraC family transcriptional regulator [Synergistaceae bacterium OttesenSCG-928-I11]|nr:AraC family transcriptional regulator [Synergistaceae bacterium OttesenSCG-928-I11]
MDTMARMNEALKYIEGNLDGEIDFGEMSRIAGCSEHHFRRMFSSLAGIPLGEYVRRRRLSTAAAELLRSGVRVIDVALKYGYDSPEAFARAFHAMHGITPGQARRCAAPVMKAYPPVTFQLTVKGGCIMEYRIVEKGAFSIVGFKKRIALQFEGVNPQMDSLVQRLTPEVAAELKSLCDVEPSGILSVSTNFAERTAEGSELDQYMGVATTKAPPARYDTLPVEASAWAVFTSIGPFPKALQDTWAGIYAEWFPTSGYESTGGPEILWNESPDTSKPDYRSEIWVPVKKIAR